ncbi:putative cytochrome P450 724B1-like [Cocos nucifera]|uniref:Putative cytochrome P450 724B1-like n=1 Tax=Cocos nucifera TaxID=13894 RepID=A0A8K0N2R1_COCNU|nr:putative cytochrome P450 724B1-like [Cocos nucifera]
MRTKNDSFISDIEENVLQVMDSWKTKETLVFCEETRKFTFHVIVKQILSLRPEDPETLEAKWRIREIVRNIWQRRESGQEQAKERMDFLDVLIDANRIPEEEVLSLVLDLLLGGYETTAMLIAIIVRFLSVKPKMLSDLKEEHLMVRRSKGENEPMEWDDYKKMEFTQCLINEALRLGNVVKFVHRKAVKPIQFKERGPKQRKEVHAIWRRHKFTFHVIVKQILSLRPEDPETLEAKWRIREIVRNIWQRRESGQEQAKERMDFLDVLIDANRIPEEEVLSLVLDLLLGGYETTAMLIAIIVRFLSVKPKMLSDLKEEHLMVRRSKGENEPMEWDDYKKMEFTQCLINEALRLGNVVKFVHRKAVKPIQFKERGPKQRKEVHAIWRRHKVVPWVRDHSFRDQPLSSPSCPQLHMDSVNRR